MGESVTHWHCTSEHIHIIITSAQKKNDVIPTFGPATTIMGWDNLKSQEYKDITVLVYLAGGMGLTNHILWNVIEKLFHHLPLRR